MSQSAYHDVVNLWKTDNGDSNNLPEWDLSDLYTDVESKDLKKDFETLRSKCSSFATDYQGKITTLDADALLQCFQRKEQIQMIAGRIMSFAYLRYQQLTTDASRSKFLTDCNEKIIEFTTPLVFFELEINRIDEEKLTSLLANHQKLARYKPEFDRLRTMKPYQLTDQVEKCLHDLSVVSNCWATLFDETITGLTFSVNKQNINIETTLDLLTSPNRDQREEAAKELASVFEQNIKIFSRILNAQMKEKDIIDQWRGMPTPQTERHLRNQVSQDVIESLYRSVVNAYPDTSHRYYELKRRWLGLDKLQIWDRSAPLTVTDSQIFSWSEARATVLQSFTSFDSHMADLARMFFENNWIDAAVKPGKAPGAFAHPTVTDRHPYIMLNFLGKPRDVMTLAHEIGHGIHQLLAAEQGEILSSTPLTLAETASVFGEMLTFRKMLAETTDSAQRKALLANKIEDMINTVVRQIAFFDFECKLHAARQKGELTNAKRY